MDDGKPQDFSLYRGDVFVFWLIQRNLRPIHIALGTFLFGFGILAVWYQILLYFQDPATSVRGLYGYFASSIGDPVFLPVISYLIFLYYKKYDSIVILSSARRFPYGQFCFTLTVLLASVVTAIFHIEAIYGTERNWTLPTYGYLNAPGYYHGVFMFLELYLIFGFSIRLIVAFATKVHPQPLKVFNTILFFFIIVNGLFCGTIASDRITTDGDLLEVFQITLREPIVWVYYATVIMFLISQTVFSLSNRGNDASLFFVLMALITSLSPFVTSSIVFAIYNAW